MPARDAYDCSRARLALGNLELMSCAVLYLQGCPLLASSRSRRQARQLSRASARRPHPLRPPYRIGTACKDISGAILAIVSSPPTSSARRPRLVQRTAVARIRNICSGHSGETPCRPVDTARTADNNADDSNVAGSSHSPGRNRGRAHNSQVRNTHNNSRTRRVFVAPRSRRQWLRKQVP